MPTPARDSPPAADAGPPLVRRAAARAGTSFRRRLLVLLVATFGGLQLAAASAFLAYARRASAAADGGPARRLVDDLAWWVAAAQPVLLLAVAAAGWAVAGVAVRPLARVRRIAAGLGPATLARPIDDVGSDAAELTDLQGELDRMRHRLDAGYQAHERFVANVSHEVKTPITAVLTEAQLLARRRELDPDVRRFVDSTSDEMRRLGRLVESFLLLTRVRHGHPPAAATRRAAVNDLVMESVAHCGPMADLHGVRLEPELAAGNDDGDALTVRGDPELLRTLLDNLIRNGVRFSPRGEAVRVVVRPGGGRPDGDPGGGTGEPGQVGPAGASVFVRDRGPGIPAELMGRLFGTAARRAADASPGRGAGLGLEIAQGIAELHGGRITARNPPDGGCELHVTLPLADAALTPPPGPAGDGGRAR